MKVRLAKRQRQTQRQHSIPALNFEELEEGKAVEFAAEVTNRFTALEAARDVTPEDVWKGTIDSPAGLIIQSNDWICQVAEEKEMHI